MNATVKQGNALETRMTCSSQPWGLFELTQYWSPFPFRSSSNMVVQELNTLLGQVLRQEEVPDFKARIQHLDHLFRLIMVELNYDPASSVAITDLLRYEEDVKLAMDAIFHGMDLKNRMVRHISYIMSNTPMRQYAHTPEYCEFWAVVWALKMTVPFFLNTVCYKLRNRGMNTHPIAFVHLTSTFFNSEMSFGWFGITQSVLNLVKQIGIDHMDHQSRLANLVVYTLPNEPLIESMYSCFEPCQFLANVMKVNPTTQTQIA